MLKVLRKSPDNSELKLLRDSGLTCSSLLYSLIIEDSDGPLLPGAFLNGEIRRLQDFIEVSLLWRALPFRDDDASLRKSITLVPLFRTILESYFRVDYIFCVLKMGSEVDWEVLRKRLDRISETCRNEYNKFAEKRAKFLSIELDALEGVSRPLNVEAIITKTQEDSAEPRIHENDKVAYSTYSLCSFYSHGYVNVGLIEAANISRLFMLGVNDLMEAISDSYLKYFVSIIERGIVFSDLIQEIRDAQDGSAYLNKSSVESH